MAQIDWSLLQQPDYFGNALKAQAMGRQQAQQDTQDSALQGYATDPSGSINKLMTVNPQLAENLQQVQTAKAQQAARQTATQQFQKGDVTGAQTTALGASDPEFAAALSKLSDEQKAQAKQRAEVLANAAYSLKGLPYEQRKPALAAMAPQLAGLGITPDQLNGFDPTDDNIRAITAQSLGLSKMIDLGKPVEMDPTKNYIQSDLVTGGAPPAASGAPATQVTPQAQPAAADPNAPRGIRNNNPLNVTSLGGGHKWDGQTGSDGQYATFATPEAGFAAADTNLQAYATKHGINTLSGIITRWAPPGSNDTGSYIKTVAQDLGLNPNAPLDLSRPEIRRAVLTSMAKVENGQPIAGGGAAPQAAAAPQASAPAGFHIVQQATQQWKPDGKGSLINTVTGDRKTDPSYDDGSSETLDDSTVSLLAGRYLKDGSLPPLGMGKAAAGARQKILNKAASMASDMGLNAGDLIAGTADVKATAAALNKQTTQLAAVRSFEDTALKNADLALSLAPKGAGQTNVPVVNRWLQAGRQSVAGDPAVTQFNIALGTFADEYAKIVTGSTGGQGSTDAARKEAYDRLSKYATQGQLTAGVATMKQEMHNRISSMEDVNEGLRAHIRGGGQANEAPASTQPTQIPAAAANYLRQNPHLAAQFDQKYGQGASARVLRGQ